MIYTEPECGQTGQGNEWKKRNEWLRDWVWGCLLFIYSVFKVVSKSLSGVCLLKFCRKDLFDWSVEHWLVIHTQTLACIESEHSISLTQLGSFSFRTFGSMELLILLYELRMSFAAEPMTSTADGNRTVMMDWTKSLKLKNNIENRQEICSNSKRKVIFKRKKAKS